MKKYILDIICCPTCKVNLKIQILEEKKDEIITGKFFCEKCKTSYQISKGIPNLLPK